MTVRIEVGDCREVMAAMPAESVNCCVTSPPYWGLRDYGVRPSLWGGTPSCTHEWDDRIKKGGGAYAKGSKKRWQHSADDFGRDDRFKDGHPDIPAGSVCLRCGAWLGCLGLEPTPEEYVEHMVVIFREVRRVLRADGTLWLNLGDSYASAGGPGWQGKNGCRSDRRFTATRDTTARLDMRRRLPANLKPKDLVGIPWTTALALRADGWWLRQEIIWNKPNPMPESVDDRCTKSHEHLFLLSKSERYCYDAAAIAEPATSAYDPGDAKSPDGWDTGPGGHGSIHRDGRSKGRSGNKAREPASARGVPVDTGGKSAGAVAGSVPWEGATRNKRSVWTVPTAPFPGAHFATFPPGLIVPCILAGCQEGGTVLDPFGGAGTTGLVADRHHRNAVLIELSPAYAEMARARIISESPLFAVTT